MYRNILTTIVLLTAFALSGRAQNTSLQDAFKHVEKFKGSIYENMIYFDDCKAEHIKVTNPSAITTATIELKVFCIKIGDGEIMDDYGFVDDMAWYRTVKIPLVALASVKEIERLGRKGVLLSAHTDAFAIMDEEEGASTKKELYVYVLDETQHADILKAFQTMFSAVQKHQGQN